MPETRTFDPTEDDDPIQAAVRAALGETIRPVQPGEKPGETASRPTEEPRASVPLTTFTFGAPPTTSP